MRQVPGNLIFTKDVEQEITNEKGDKLASDQGFHCPDDKSLAAATMIAVQDERIIRRTVVGQEASPCSKFNVNGCTIALLEGVSA
jgi:hypothetical protein